MKTIETVQYCACHTGRDPITIAASTVFAWHKVDFPKYHDGVEFTQIMLLSPSLTFLSAETPDRFRMRLSYRMDFNPTHETPRHGPFIVEGDPGCLLCGGTNLAGGLHTGSPAQVVRPNAVTGIFEPVQPTAAWRGESPFW